MENEWEVLDINDLPHDILVKSAWEYRVSFGHSGVMEKTGNPILVCISDKIDGIEMKIYIRRQRLPELKSLPTHNEIMTKWWKDEKDAR